MSVSPLPCEEVQSEKEVDSTCVGDDEGGFVDMQVSNTTEDTPSEYMSTCLLCVSHWLNDQVIQLSCSNLIKSGLPSIVRL